MFESPAWPLSVTMGNFRKLADLSQCGERRGTRMEPTPPHLGHPSSAERVGMAAAQRPSLSGGRGGVNPTGKGGRFGEGGTDGGHGRPEDIRRDRSSTAGPVSTVRPFTDARDRMGIRTPIEDMRTVATFGRSRCTCVVRGCLGKLGGTQRSVTWREPRRPAGFRRDPSRFGSGYERTNGLGGSQRTACIQAVGPHRSHLPSYGVRQAVEGCTGRGAVR